MPPWGEVVGQAILSRSVSSSGREALCRILHEAATTVFVTPAWSRKQAVSRLMGCKPWT